MPRGGARPGAGRKPTRERFARPVEQAEKRIADRLPEFVDNQILLALGGGERIEERWEAAGTVAVDDVLRGKDGQPILNERGQPLRAKVPAFPDLPIDQMVLVERKVITMGPDRAANEYLLDRIMGKPTTVVEAEVSGPAGGDIPLLVRSSVDQVYGNSDSDSDADADRD